MLKVESFITGYAEYLKDMIDKNNLANKEQKREAINYIDWCVMLREKGIITVTESLKMLLNEFS